MGQSTLALAPVSSAQMSEAAHMAESAKMAEAKKKMSGKTGIAFELFEFRPKRKATMPSYLDGLHAGTQPEHACDRQPQG
jgi:hypothetical protein